MDPRPTFGGAAGAAPAGCHDIKQVLYESSKKSEISDQELQEIFAKPNMGADPNKKLSEEDARALRNIIDGWKVRGEVLKLPSQEAEAAKEQAIARKERILAKIMGSCDDEPPQPCGVCMKVDHWSLECPYLDEIPNPENTTVGKDYEIRCHRCNKSDHGHPDGSWPGYAWKKSGFWTTPDERDSDTESDEWPLLCEVCMKVVDWSFECPYLKDIPNPQNTPVGEGYEIRCHHCNKSDHGHPNGSWAGYAWNKAWT